MDLSDSLDQLSAKIERQMSLLQTEEATKNALVMPFINALGYNVFDPTEVIPEFVADVGTKKGEKVDYVIVIEGKPAILIECKPAGSKLSLDNASQLYRYFSVTDARFAVLTNGVDYQFYTDVESPNKMDSRPFFEFSMLAIDARVVAEVKKFAKSQFDVDQILSNASELKYLKQIRNQFDREFEGPSEDFVRLFTSRVYDGRITESIREQFTDLVQSAFRDFVRDHINTRLQSAIEGGASLQDEASEPEEEDTQERDGVVTTAEEIEAFHIVRAISSKAVSPDRVVMRDTKSYCGILLDDNNRKPICRLHFNTGQKYIGLFDAKKQESRIAIEALTEIYQHESQIVQTVGYYEGGNSPDS